MQESTGVQQAAGFLRGAGTLWFLTALCGQAAFIVFIVMFYGKRTLMGKFAAWNDKPLIKGYVEGDHAGNSMFIVHVLLAAVITLGGLLQLIAPLRRKFPALHRWNGRLFMVIAFVMAFGGIWLTWVRHTQLSMVSAVAITLNGGLLILCASIAWWHATARRIDAHKPWAMRTFMLANGVWFLRVGIMAWIILNRGSVGMDGKLSGPVDIVLVFGCYLIPLLGLEAYFAAQRSQSSAVKALVALMVVAITAFMAVGVFGTSVMMWGKYL